MKEKIIDLERKLGKNTLLEEAIGDFLKPLERDIKLISDEIKGGYINTIATGVSKTEGGVVMYEQKARVRYAKPFSRPPAVTTTIVSPSAWGIEVGITLSDTNSFDINVWRINKIETVIMWIAVPRNS